MLPIKDDRRNTHVNKNIIYDSIRPVKSQLYAKRSNYSCMLPRTVHETYIYFVAFGAIDF